MKEKKRQPEWLVNLMVLTVSLMVSFSIGEVALRQIYSGFLAVYDEERSLLYRYDEKLGWFPLENSSNTFTGSRTISVTHNNRGFRDKEHVASNRPGIVFLGDSFVWGYDVEQADRFTEKLQSRIPGWDIYNLGVSGYGTDQEYLLLKKEFSYFKPHLVFLVFCTDNDDHDNMTNTIGDGAYYKPYFIVHNNKPELKGVPVPASLTYFARQHSLLAKSYVVRLLKKALSPRHVHNVIPPTVHILLEMNEFVQQKGSQLVVGLIGRHLSLEHVMKRHNIAYVQLDESERYEEAGKHWTPAGHTTVSHKIYDFLSNAGLLNFAKTNKH